MSSNGEQANKPSQNGAPVCPTSPSKRVPQRRDLRIAGAGRRAPPTQAADFSRVDGWPNDQRLARVLGAPPLVAVTGGSARGVCPGPRPPPPRHHTNIPRGVERHTTKHVNQRRRHAAGSIDEEPDEQAEEEARVTALLDQSQATETTPTSAPVLLQAAAATDKSINLDAKDRPEAKKAQLDTLLAKAEQYSQFIVNSQQAEAEPSKKKRKTGLEDAAEKMKKEKALVVQPKAMTGGTLKPYQVEGLRWLATLFENGLSGILADEMGLGKTIQVIALVAHVREKNVKGPICIAAPLATRVAASSHPLRRRRGRPRVARAPSHAAGPPNAPNRLEIPRKTSRDLV